MANNQSTQFELPEIIMEGERNNTIFKYGVKLKQGRKNKDEPRSSRRRTQNAASRL